MTKFTTITNTFYNNPKGIIVSKLPIDLYEIKGILKFYRFNINDIVEISFIDDVILVFEFSHNKEKSLFIKDDILTYAEYFKSAGLEGKRFLFDLNSKVPVSSVDFVEMEQVPNIKNDSFLLLANSDSKSVYITEEKSVIAFCTTTRTENIDKCILSLRNNSKYLHKPKRYELYGCATAAIVVGLLNDVKLKGITEDAEIVNPTYKFITNLSRIEYKSYKPNVKINEFKKIITGVDSEIDSKKNVDIKKSVSKGTVQLSNLVEVGLDKFLKIIDDNNLIITVKIDTMTNIIKRAYISQGVLFIDPFSLVNVSYVREMLDSDNIELYLL